jgi:hypothetical protein
MIKGNTLVSKKQQAKKKKNESRKEGKSFCLISVQKQIMEKRKKHFVPFFLISHLLSNY